MSGRPVDAGAQRARGRPASEDIAWLGLWPASLLLIVCVLWVAPPLSDLYPEPTQRFYDAFLVAIKPEPLEATRVLFALAIPVVLAALALLGSAGPARRRCDPAIIAFQLAAFGLVVWGVLEQQSGPYFPSPPGYFEPLLLSAPVLVGGAVLGVVLTLLALRGRTPFTGLDRPDPAWKGWLVAAAVVLTALWLLPAILTDGLLTGSGSLPSTHTLIQGEDYSAVVNGLTPTVDYVAQYSNVLPLVVAPLLAAFGLSTTSFTISMVALSLVALLAVYGVFREATRRHWAALALYVPYLALSLFPFHEPGLGREFAGGYFGILPGRYLGPFVVAWLCARSVRRRLPVWLLGLAAGLTVLNNAEFGLPCALALLAALFLGSDRAIPIAVRARAILGQAAIGALAAVALVCAVVLARSGELPDPALLTYYTKIFARDGFGLVPMPTLGLHIAVYLTYVAALLTAAVRYASPTADRATTAMLAYAGVFGLLTAEYFAGRSLPWQLMLLFPAWGLALGLLAWVSARHLRSLGGDRTRLRRTLVPSLAAMAGFGVMVAAIVTFPLPWRQVERLSQDGQPLAELLAAQGFVEAETEPGEAILLLGSQADHRVAEAAGVANVSPWNGAVSLYSSREFTRAMDALGAADGTKVFLQRGLFLPAESRSFEPDPAADQATADRILQARGFEKEASEQTLELWRRADP